MALEQRDIKMDTGNGRVRPGMEPGHEPSLGELFGQLSSDAGRLIRQEVALAKTELREAGATLARDGAKIAMAAALGLVGALAAVAFLIIALGDLLDNYWLSALIVTVVLLGVAAFLAKSAINDIKNRGLKPEVTLQTIREDTDWAKREAQDLKRDLTAKGNY
jgi:uncharacterized membrane protein YqjE